MRRHSLHGDIEPLDLAKAENPRVVKVLHRFGRDGLGLCPSQEVAHNDVLRVLADSREQVGGRKSV